MTGTRWYVALGLTAAAGVAQAQLTYVNPDGGGANENERCLVGVNGMCEGGAYDGAISIIRALEMDLGGSLVRVDDGLDQLWTAIGNQNGNLVGRARYAADTLRLGYDSGAGYVDLVGNIPAGQVRVSDVNMFGGAQSTNYSDSFQAVSGWTPVSLTPGTVFAFILSDLTVTNRWTSNNSGSGVGSAGYSNSANLDDHMVTFQLSPTHYIIAWEDRPFGASGTDLDYNDMVLEVRWLTPVPLPAALPLLLSGLLGFLGLARAKSSRTR